MSLNLVVPPSNGCEKVILSEEQHAKICEVRRLLGPLSGKSSIYCSDPSILRYLRARNWNVKKATKMLKATLKWRSEYKPEEIQWDEVAHEAETGKVYCANYNDRHGRTVLVMRPCRQNSKTVKGQIRYLVYCMENAILNLPPDQESMIWLIDFKDFDMSNISLKATKETAHVLQEHYPERLGLAILYNPPKFFEPFWMVAKPFLETKTTNKVKFVYSDDVNSKRIIEDLFDMDQLESAFGGNNNNAGFNITKYAEMMKEDDKQMRCFWSGVNPRGPASEKAQSSSGLADSKTSNSSSESPENERTDGDVHITRNADGS
ncbi:phosphatidylinositol transfer protein 3-like isoform X2 [Benincasa hispida]|nr:phosphatidylinositol transfer protein 3-like isoform X2 [Benincasa hispida]XP_038899983.1 phosphatidylinositol transfer protein 3-like isoform X2 [Benincasa hispida]